MPYEKVCRPCRNEWARAWAAANPEKRAAANRKYHQANAAEIRRVNNIWKAQNAERLGVAVAAYLARNKESIRAKRAEYSILNKVALNAKSAEWRRANPEKTRIQQHNRRARVRGAVGRLSKNLFERLYVLQRGKCACCGADLGKDCHMDHIVPLSKGGANVDSNMQLLTLVCNIRKHARDPIEYMQSKGFLI